MHKAKLISLPQPAARINKLNWSVKLDGVSLIDNSKSIISDVSCRLSSKGISVIMGENGAGKSMLLKMIAGLVVPTEGLVQLHPSLAGRTAMVFQSPVLLRRTTRGNLNHALKIARVGKRYRRKKIATLLDICGLTSLADQQAKKLSGGEQQRLQMARTLASEPKLLLMDEPTTNLDPRSILAIEELIQETNRSGVKIILVTHNLGQAKRLADEVLFLTQGQLEEQGDAKKLFAHSNSETFNAFIEGRLII